MPFGTPGRRPLLLPKGFCNLPETAAKEGGEPGETELSVAMRRAMRRATRRRRLRWLPPPGQGKNNATGDKCLQNFPAPRPPKPPEAASSPNTAGRQIPQKGTEAPAQKEPPERKPPGDFGKTEKLISWRTGERGGLPSDRTSYAPSYGDRGSGSRLPSEQDGTRHQPRSARGQHRGG